MSLNIKDPETNELAAELARRTGVSMTEAVTQALREKLASLAAPGADALKREQAAARVEAALAIAEEIRERVGAEALTASVERLLYDEAGLPR
jgi:antitoxin VapB